MNAATRTVVSPDKSVNPDLLLMSVTNQRVAAHNTHGSNAHAGWLADLRAGITPAGELRAIARAAPYITGLGARSHSAAIRAAAIRAINRDVSNSRNLRLGRSLARLDLMEGGSSVSGQVDVLPLMPMDGAALIFDGLIGRCAKHGIAINFEGLAKTLIHWGSGDGARSVDRRTQVVLDFYLGAQAEN